MSWEEYKKKREDKSSWEQYKQKRENKIQETRISNNASTTQKKTSLWENIKYIAKKTGAGAASGTAGIAQGQLTDMANSVRKSEQKNGVRVTTDLLNALTGLSNPTTNIIKSAPEQIAKSIKTAFDKDKNVLQKITTLGMDAVTDYTNNLGVKKLSDATLGIAGKINNNLDETILGVNNKISEPINNMNIALEEEGKKYGAVTNTLADVGQAVGNMTPAIVATAITKNPQMGLATMGLSAKGQSTQDALNKGAELNEAVKIGNTKAMIEVGTEMLTGGVNIFGKGAIDDIIEKGIVKKVKNNVAQFLVKQGANAFGEVTEETISDILGTAIDKGTIDPNAKYTLKDWGDTALTTVLTTFVLNTITGGVVNDIKQIKSEKQAEQNAQHWLKQAENIIQENSTTNLQQNSANNQNIAQEQQITQQENKAVQNGISKQTNDIMNNKGLPMQNYQYEKSDNPKINNLRQDASQYFNNTEKARNFVNMLEKIITDKDIDIRLDTNLKTSDGKIVNGSYSNGTITINPNSTRTGEFIAVHELTHAIGTDSMKNIIETYRKSNPEFNSAVTKLLQNYNSNEITEEALSDVSAQLFGNQEFINNVAQTNPNIFKKIYSEIKYLWHQFRGYKNQDQFIEDLYYKWTQAYNSSNKLNETSNYYIEPIANFKETEYNNIIEEKLTKKEYAILRSIINSDSNIKPGINYVEVTNGRYTVYYKGFDDFKVMSRKVDADAGRINTRNDTTGRKTRYSKTFEQSIGNKRTTTSNDEISNINTQGTRERSGSDTSSSTNIENVKYSIQESENNSGSFNLTKNTFDVSGNENLANAQTLFYRTREDGQYYVQATDGSGKIIYDGVFYGEKQLARSLGEEIAKKIVNTSENTNNEIYLQSDNIKNETNYMMAHRPTETGAYASNITKGTGEWESLMPEDVYEHPEWYFDMNQEYSKESFKVLKQIKNNPNAIITIYRATTGNKINVGDWVTLSKKYAEYHNNSQFNGKGNIIELKVKAKDVQYAGDDINEFGYFPQTDIQTTNNSDIKFSQNNETWQQYLDENYKTTGTRTNLKDIRLPVKETNKFPVNQEAEIANILQKPQEKVKEKDRSWAIIKANLIDKGMVFEELSRKTGNRELQGKWDATLTATARGQNAIGNARYELDPKTKTQNQISKSLTDIIDEVGENTADFYAYMYHQLNIDRMTLEDRFGGDTGINYERKNPIMNKPVFGDSVSAKKSRQKVAELERKYPEFKEYAQDVYDYLDANTKELVDNGVISKETQQLFKDMYPHYVPISRVRNKGQAINVPLDTGRTGINSPIKKATGGSSDINPLFETMADRTLQTYRASARNSFGVELKNTLGKTNQIFEKVNVDTIMENMTDEEQNKQLLQEGKNGENPTFTVFENGNKVTYEITKDMYDALKPKNELLSKIDENKASKIANKINNFRRGLLTEYNPVFSITNAIKDSQDILLNSQHSTKTYAKIPEATAQILSKGYWYNEYIQNGGSQNSYFKDGEFETIKNNLPTKIKNTITFPLRAISNVNNVIEMTPRLAEYIVSREQGRSIETSMLDAARVTTNFKAGGDITKTLNRNGFTFLNASVQGMQQQIRNVQEANAKGLKGYAVLACKYAIAGAPVLLLNNLLWADDDEYEELQDYVKDNYYIIGKLPNGKFLRIPKGRAVATIQKIVSNVNDFIKNDSINSDEVGKIFWEDMKENIQFGIDNLAPNNPMENNILSPIFQAITNKTWYGDDLVPTRLQNKPKEEQYDETTDSFSRWLGEKTGISPIKINYLIDQYSGGVGDILLPLGTPQAENNVIEDKFTTDATMKNKYPGEFFTKVDELEINSNSSKATDEDILKYKYISSISTEIGKLYTKKREIQNSSATDKEKKAQLKEVQEQINELAKNSLEAVEKIQNTSTTATIGDKKYYKYHDEWTALSEEEIKKNKNISLKTYADYKNKVYSQTQTKRAKGELSETQSLKNKDKIQIILDSKYSNNEISAIYDNYIKSSSDTEYDIMKATGIDIKEYLKYKQQEFTSDKDDDGTLAGKTVSKSKQKKVVEYLNSMNIKGNQRLLLYAMQGYTTTSSQKTQLANYVKGLKIDNNTKLKLYDKFSGFTVYKDGTIKY